MGLLDKLNDPTPPRRKIRCRMATILNTLDPAETVKINEILESLANLEGRYTSNWLASVLKEAGHSVNHQSILRHARKECCCES